MAGVKTIRITRCFIIFCKFKGKRMLVMGIYAPTNTYRDFNSTISQGNGGEELLKNYMSIKGFQIIDRSNDPLYQLKDIDFEFSRNGNKWSSVEVKSDYRMAQTGNIVVEVAMYRKSGKSKGWLYYCEADYLCFIDMQSYDFYFFDWKKLQQEVLNGRWRFTKFNNGTDNCEGEVCKIPLKDLFNMGLVVIKDKIYFG